MKTDLSLVIVLLAAVAGSACTTTRAATVPIIERPALDVPPVPPRNIEPIVPLPPAPGPEPVADLPPAPAGGNSARAKSPPPVKPDPKTEAPPAEPATPAAQPTVPPLRTPGTPDAIEATRRIRETSARAQGILDKTDYQALNRERREQYENAKLLITQAEAAIKAANFEFARNLAEKAERLARELQGR